MIVSHYTLQETHSKNDDRQQKFMSETQWMKFAGIHKH